MKIGFYEQHFDIQFPTLLAGYATKRQSYQIHDPISVRAVVIQQMDRKILMLNYDLIGFDHLLNNEIYKLSEEFSISKQDVFLCATHTHSAPGGLIDVRDGILKGSSYVMMDNDSAWLTEVVSKTKKAIAQAIDNLSDGIIEYALQEVDNVGSNRNNKALSGDKFMTVFKFSNMTSSIIAYNYSCHPTVLKGDNILVSADFPGSVNKNLKKEGYQFAFFMNGSSGDISTRFTRQNDGFEEVERFGNILSSAIISSTKEMKQISDVDISWNSVNLTTKQPMEEHEARLNLKNFEEKVTTAKRENRSLSEIRVLESYVEGALGSLEYAINNKNINKYTIDIQSIHLGEITLVAIPGELFSELSNKIENHSIRFISYANGYYGYFANASAYDENYYEALSSPFERFEAEKMMKEIYKTMGGTYEYN